MEYIMKNYEKKEEEWNKEEKYNKAKKEAVAKVKKGERKSNRTEQKVTHLYKPALTPGKPPRPPRRVTKKWCLETLLFIICSQLQ